jgi:hypothetical protein
VITLAKLVLPSMLASRAPPGAMDANEVIREAAGGIDVADFFANMKGPSPADVTRAEDALIKDLAAGERS